MSQARSLVVTGAAGFIGSHLCERLVADGHRVVGVDCLTNAYSPTLKRRNVAGLAGDSSFALVEADLCRDDLGKILRGADAVLHFAGRGGVRDRSPAPYVRDNLEATRRLLEACAAACVPRIVHASSSSLYAPSPIPAAEDWPLRPTSPYGRSKLACEQLWARSGLPVVTLRYFTVYGPRQRPDMAFARFISAAIEVRSAPLFGGGAHVRDFTYVDDAVEATVRAHARGRPGVAYNVSGGCPVSLMTALDQLARALRRPVAYERRRHPSEEPLRTHACLARARAELGYRPATGLAEGLRLQVAAALDAQRDCARTGALGGARAAGSGQRVGT